MGIFKTPVEAAVKAGNIYIYFGAWLFGGIIALCGALTYAEIGSNKPATGGYYTIFSYAYHPSIAFAINCIIILSNAVTLAVIGQVGGQYINEVLVKYHIINDHPFNTTGIAIASIIIFYMVNMLGLRTSATTQNILMIIKIGMIVLLITAIFFNDKQTIPVITLQSQSVAPSSWVTILKSFGLALISVSFTYGGYQQSINFGDEVHNVQKTIPKSIFTGILVVLVLYMLINYAYVSVIGFETLKTSTNIANILIGQIFGSGSATILSIFLFLSVLAFVNIYLLSNPRVMQAMANDNTLPKAFAKRNSKTNVLTTSLTVFAGLAIAIISQANTIDKLLGFTIFLDCLGFILSAAVVFKLRKSYYKQAPKETFKMRLYPIIPIIFILAYVFIATSIFIDSPGTGLLGLGIVGFFVALYFATRLTKGKQST
jgi:basic amino acid/polyamine antiporter, APA family